MAQKSEIIFTLCLPNSVWLKLDTKKRALGSLKIINDIDFQGV